MLETLKQIWVMSGDNRYMFIFIWISGIIAILLNVKLYKDDRVSMIILIIYDLVICTLFTVFYFSYFLDKLNIG